MERPQRRPRGSVLALAMILLAVLSFIGIMAIVLSTQERMNSSYHSQYDKLVQCANAAQAQLYSEVAAYGSGYMKGSMAVTGIKLPDGSQIVAPAHMDQASQVAAGTLTVNNVVLYQPNGAAGTVGDMDSTNRARGTKIGGAYNAVAYCQDSQGRRYEVEFGVRFAL